MEMHLALIVDGYKFVETGFNFNQLPNSRAQLALPEWRLEQPASPVSLGSTSPEGESGNTTVTMSDGSVYLICQEVAGETKLVKAIWSVAEETWILPLVMGSSCDDSPSIETFNPYNGETNILPLTMELTSCSIEDDVFDTDIILRFEGYEGGLVGHINGAELDDSWGMLFDWFTPIGE